MTETNAHNAVVVGCTVVATTPNTITFRIERRLFRTRQRPATHVAWVWEVTHGGVPPGPARAFCGAVLARPSWVDAPRDARPSCPGCQRALRWLHSQHVKQLGRPQ